MTMTELSVCTECILAIANGEATEEHGEKMDVYLAHNFDVGEWIVPDGEELGFCTTPCDTCGDTLHGDRFRATVLVEGM